MGQIIRCPLTGLSCGMPVTIEERSFFLAEAEEPQNERQRRQEALTTVIEREHQFKIRSALDESDINAFTCKICTMIQTCAYGIADITDSNPNVLLELGMMIALGKPTLILVKRGQEEKLKLPSDIIDREVIPFQDYTEIMPKLRKMMESLPSPVSPPSPIVDLEEIEPQFTQELKRMEANIVREFKSSIRGAKLDKISIGKEEKDVSPELSEKLKTLEGQLENMNRLGITMDAETASLKGNYLHYVGNYEEALISFNLSLELRPNDPDTLTHRAEINMHLGRHKEAIVDCNRALEIKPNSDEALDVRGSAYAFLGKLEEALADHNRSLELKPDDPIALFNRGGTYVELERYNEAVADFSRSLELSPDDPDTLHARGNTYVELERYNEAVADFNRSLELSPDDPVTLANRGITYSDLGRYEEALADLNRSLELRPDDPSTFYNLACLFSLLRKPDDALAYLEKVIKGDEKYREDAKTDKDFDNIRDNPRFKKLIESD